MKAYANIRFEQYPDIADIKAEGRKSAVGRIGRGRGYASGFSKAQTRRYLKRVNRASDARFEAKSEG
jgi:hypothetical protein